MIDRTTHNRCQDWNTEPGVYYHAHDLPPCQEEGVRWVKDRWCCERHAQQREGTAGRGQSHTGTALPVPTTSVSQRRSDGVANPTRAEGRPT